MAITGTQLTIEDIEAVACFGETVKLRPDALRRIVAIKAKRNHD